MDDQIPFFRVSIDQFMQAKALSREAKKKTQRPPINYRTILDSFIDVIFIIDEDGYFVFVNKASEKRTGITTQTFINRHFLEVIDPKYHVFAQSSFQKAMNGEKIPPFEMQRVTAEGEKITQELDWTTLYRDGVAVALIVVARDVTNCKRAEETLKRAREELEMRVRERTEDLLKANELLKKEIEERKRTEEELKESEEKYRSLFENSKDAIFITDTKTGTILDANRQAERLTGRSRQEIIGMHQSRLHSAQDNKYFKKKFQKHIKYDRVFDLEAEVVQKDGTVVPVFICSSLIDLQGKKVIQGIFRDISKETMILDLKGELAAKRLVNRAKAIIANRYKINDSDAMRLLQRESRKQSRKLKEVAQAVVSSNFILD